MISNEPVITVSPEETTTYRLKVTTEKGLVDYTNIIVYVRDVLECRFDYNTGNVVSQYRTVLTKKQALSKNWNHNGSSVTTPVDFSNLNPRLVSANKGGIIFTSECYIPDNSNTLIVGISVDNVTGIELYNDKLVIDNEEFPFNEESYISFELSAIFNTEGSKWDFSATVTNTITKETIIEVSKDVEVGVFDSELYLYFIGSTVAKSGFYYGTNGVPVAIITRDHLSVLKGTKVQLDSSESFDPNGDLLNFEWFSKSYGSSRFKRLYKYNEVIEETINETKIFKVQASDFDNTSETEVIVTCYTVEQLDSYTYQLKAVQDDVQALYTYEWSSSDGTVSSLDNEVIVQPLGDIVYTCVITEISTGIQDSIEISLSGELRVLHAYDTVNDIYQEIKIYPDTRLLTKFIECSVNGVPGYIAVGNEDNLNKSILRCRINGVDYRILIHV